MHSVHAHKTLQYLFCAHLLVKKRWTQKFAFHSDWKKRCTPASITTTTTQCIRCKHDDSHQHSFSQEINRGRESGRLRKRRTIAHSWRCIGRCIHFTIIRFRCSMLHHHPVSACIIISLAFWYHVHSAMLCKHTHMHTVAGHAQVSFFSGGRKKDICFVAQNLTGVKEILGKRHTDSFSAAYQRREKRWRDSERRRAKNGNAKNWIRVWNMHFRILLLFLFGRFKVCSVGCCWFPLFFRFGEVLWTYQCWRSSCIELISRVCDYIFFCTSLIFIMFISFSLSFHLVGWWSSSFDSVCELYVLFSRCVKRCVWICVFHALN